MTCFFVMYAFLASSMKLCFVGNIFLRPYVKERCIYARFCRDSRIASVEKNIKGVINISNGSGVAKWGEMLGLICYMGVRAGNGSMGHGSLVKWVTKFRWVTWVMGH